MTKATPGTVGGRVVGFFILLTTFSFSYVEVIFGAGIYHLGRWAVGSSESLGADTGSERGLHWGFECTLCGGFYVTIPHFVPILLSSTITFSQAPMFSELIHIGLFPTFLFFSLKKFLLIISSALGHGNYSFTFFFFFFS